MQSQPHSLVPTGLNQRQDKVKTAGDQMGCRSCRKVADMPANRLRGSTPDFPSGLTPPPLTSHGQQQTPGGRGRLIPVQKQSHCPLPIHTHTQRGRQRASDADELQIWSVSFSRGLHVRLLQLVVKGTRREKKSFPLLHLCFLCSCMALVTGPVGGSQWVSCSLATPSLDGK